MRILISLSYYIPNTSGLTICVKNIAEEMVKRKHAVTVLTSQHEKKLLKKETIKGVSIQRVLYIFKSHKALFMPSYIFYALGAVRATDVVVINLPQFEGFVIAILAKILGKPLYCIYHCEISLPKSFANWLIEKLLHVVHSIVLLCSDKIITYTEDYANNSILLPLFAKKLNCIYPPVPPPVSDTEMLKKIQHTLAKKVKYHIGIAARISAEKGFEYVFSSIPLLQEKLGKDFIFLIAGPKNPIGEEGYWRKLHPLIEQYKEYTCFLGSIPYEKLGSFYSLLDIFILPSINSTEAFGIVQIEAMLSGVPVITTDLPGVRIPVQKTGMGKIIPTKNAKALADAIFFVLKNKKIFIKDKKIIEKEFSYKKTMDFYENIFKTTTLF